MNVGALTNEKNVEGRQTPLHLLTHSQLRFPSFIRNKKVDKMALNNQNLTALDVISSTEDLFGRKIPWMNVGALTNEKNVEGQTPLHLLADSQLRFRSDYIRNKKVDKMTLNNQNLTAIDVISSVEDLFGGKVSLSNYRLIAQIARNWCTYKYAEYVGL
ncbi:hypothetical protein AAG906_012095 [Vitis piasezkii]